MNLRANVEEPGIPSDNYHVSSRVFGLVQVRMKNGYREEAIAWILVAAFLFIVLSTSFAGHGPLLPTLVSIPCAILLARQLRRTKKASLEAAVFEHSPDFCCVLTRTGQIISANRKLGELLGVDPSSLNGLNILDFLDEEDWSRAKSVLSDIAEFKQDLEFETQIKTAEKRWVAWAGGSHSEAERIYLTGRDVTFRRVATDELFESEGRYRMVVDNAKEIIFRRDAMGRWLFLNPAWHDLTGFTVEDTIGKHYIDFVHPDDVKRRSRYDQNLIKHRKQLGRQEVRCLCADGTYKWVEATYRFQYDSEGNVIDTVGALMDVTDRKAADEALKRERDFTEAIVETVGALVVVFDLDGHIVRFNRACEETTGYTHSEVTGKPFWDIFNPPESAAASKAIFFSLAGGNFPGSHESIWLSKSGDKRLIHWTTTCILNTDGTVRYVIGTGADVTQARATQAELARSQERFELAVQGSSDGLWDWDLVADIRYFSPRWKQMLGYEDYELASDSKTFDSLVHPDDAAAVEKHLADYLAGTSDIFKIEFRMRHKSGGYRWILARGKGLANESGVIYRMAGSHTDVTEQRAAEEAIRRSEAGLAEAQFLAKVGSWEYDLRTNSVTWSTEAFRLFGLEPSDTPPSDGEYQKLLHPDDLKTLRKCLSRARRTGEAYEIDQRVILPDGTMRYIAAKGLGILDDQGKVIKIAGTLQDITERKLAERELVEARESALESARLKSEFLANMSHEIRTPMNGVIGMAELLSGTELNDEQRSFAATIQESAESLLNILNDILDFSKIEAGKMQLDNEPFAIANLAKDLESFFSPIAARKGLVFSTEIEEGVAAAYHGDRLRLRQIISNLLGNAFKFTEIGSVTLRILGAEKGIRIEVADTGIGIPANRLDTIFESFTQADGSTTRRYGGTGLGLAIVSQLSELMLGSTGVMSTEGLGSTFWVELPLRPAALAPVQEEHPKLERKLRQQLHVLLAEDNEVNRRVALKNLLRFGATVDVATTGLQALEMAIDNRYDLIIMDVQMPEMDGLEAVRRLREAEAESGTRTRVIAMTAHAMQGDRERCLEAGMDDYMSKPIQTDRLFEVLEASQTEAGEKVFDFAHLEDLSGGDTEFEQEIIETFLAQAPDLMRDLEQAVAGGTFDLALRYAHTLKGSGRSIGANDFAMCCEKIEDELRNGGAPDLTILQPKLDRLRRATTEYYSQKAA